MMAVANAAVGFVVHCSMGKWYWQEVLVVWVLSCRSMWVALPPRNSC